MNKRIKKNTSSASRKPSCFIAKRGSNGAHTRKRSRSAVKPRKKCWQYALECGHENALDEKPIFRPKRKYVFAVTQTYDFRRFVEPIRVTPIDADKPAHRDTPRPTRNSR